MTMTATFSIILSNSPMTFAYTAPTASSRLKMEGALEQRRPQTEEGDDDLAALSPKRKAGTSPGTFAPGDTLGCEVSSPARSLRREAASSSRSLALSDLPPKSIVIEHNPDDPENAHDSWGGTFESSVLEVPPERRNFQHVSCHAPQTPPPQSRRASLSSRPAKDMTDVTQRLRERFASGTSRRNSFSRSPLPGTPTSMRDSISSSAGRSKRLSTTDSFGSLADSDFSSFGQSLHEIPNTTSPIRRKRRVFTIQRDQLIDSLAWFSCHTPLSVLEDLTFHELALWRSEIRASIVRHESSTSDDGSMSSLSADGGVVESIDSSFEEAVFETESPLGLARTMSLPYSIKRNSAVLFVDITGFTKLSTLLDVETLSKVINTYFDRIVQEVSKCHGDIIKFAGDAFFAEWRVQEEEEVTEAGDSDEPASHPLESLRRSLRRSKLERSGLRSLADCAMAASLCGAAIVEQYSDYQVPVLRDVPVVYGGDKDDRKDSMLNVHCGVGVGSVVGLHVGDHAEGGENGSIELRREYLLLGSPIDQVSLAAEAASDGQVLASPEAVKELGKQCNLSVEILSSSGPVCIASREVSSLSSSHPPITSGREEMQETQFTIHDALHKHCSGVDRSVLARLHTQLALYVHPVVRGDELSSSTSHHGKVASRHASQSRQIAEAELRSVYTLFVKALVSPKLSDDDGVDQRLYHTLGSIMHVVCRELQRYSGHLRQFIIDDKGVVLIGTFGLRGSTFPNMVPNSALPATFSIRTSLKTELGIDSRIGATFGKVYCGVIGGIRRHEFSVMGAPVNLAARLMYSPTNTGILVDEAVQAQAGARFAFRMLPPVRAKGYERPVTIVEPLHAVSLNKRRGGPPSFVGRTKEVQDLVQVATSIVDATAQSETAMAFVVGESGMGKTVVGFKACEDIRQLCILRKKKVAVSRSSSTETEQRIPLSSFRKVLLNAIKDFCMYDGTISPHEEGKKRGSLGLPRSQRSVRGPGLLGQQVSQRSQRSVRGPGLLSRQISQRSQRSVRGPGMPGRQLSQRSQRGLTPPLASTRSQRGLGSRGLSRRRLLSRRFSQSSSTTMSNSIRSVIVPYFEKLCWVCEELDYPHEYADIVGSQLLRVEGASPTVSNVDGHVPTVDEVVDFLTLAYLRVTEFSDLSMVFFDDFQWIDALSWKIIRSLCQRRDNLFLICAMRSHDKQAFRRMSSVQVWHGQMQSRIIEVSLGPLELSEVKELIGRVLGYGESAIDENLCTDVYNKTGGVPIYTVQFLENIKRDKTVSLDETGILQWTDAARNEQCRLGANSVAVIEESFLNRFDSLDRSVREVLQTCAVLGETFTYVEVVRVHPELVQLEIEQALEAAVDELILVEDIFDDDEDDLSLLSDLGMSAGGGSRAAIYSPEDRCFQFSHAMWRSSVLNKMLKERRIELHRLIAQSMENEQIKMTESSDIARVLTLFDHWKVCGEFCKAAPLSLTVGLRLEDWDLLDQSLNLYQDSLNMCYENATVVHGRHDQDSNEDYTWVLACATPVALDLILRLHIRIGRCLFLLGRQGESEDTFKDAFKIVTTSEAAAEQSKSLMLPIVSGLCSICFERMVYAESALVTLEAYLEHFVAAARRDGNPVHICRALSMESTFFARIGQFERALSSMDALKDYYNFQAVSAELSDEYGRDFALQCLADSVQWYCVVGDTTKAQEQAGNILNTIFPHLQDEDIDSRLETLFPILMAMKSMGKSATADAILKDYVINPYRDPYHELSSKVPTWLPLYNPLVYLLEIVVMEDSEKYDDELLDEMEEWVLKDEIGHFPFDLRRKGNLLVGEICWRLANRREDGEQPKDELLEKCRSLLYYVVFDDSDDQSDLFMVKKAKAML